MQKLAGIILLALTIFTVSCGTPSGTASTKLSKTATTLSQNDWQLFSMNGQKITVPDGGRIPTLSFDPQNMTVSGNSSCNSFSGSFTADKDALSFGNLAGTRMMCPDMKMETAFLSTIANAKNFSIYESKLVLNDASGKQLMAFDPLPK